MSDLGGSTFSRALSSKTMIPTAESRGGRGRTGGRRQNHGGEATGAQSLRGGQTPMAQRVRPIVRKVHVRLNRNADAGVHDPISLLVARLDAAFYGSQTGGR